MNTNTISGNIASFYTPRQVDLSSLKVHFSPKQLGEGDPSPSNVREIVGRNSAEAYVCGKNLLNPGLRTNKYTDYVQKWGRNSSGYADGSIVLEAGTYTISITGADETPTEWQIKDDNDNYIVHKYSGYYSCTFTLTEKTPIGIYISVNNRGNNIYALQNCVMLEMGSTATQFESYTTYVISDVLPDDYYQVEYLESTETQYIDTGLQLSSNNFKISCDFEKTKISAYEQAIFSIWTSAYNYWNCFIQSTNKIDVYTSGHYRVDSPLVDVNSIGNVTLERVDNQWTVTYKGQSTTWTYNPPSVNNTTLKIFTRGDTKGSNTNIRMYSFNVKVADEVVANYIPCIRKSDNKPGMYDTVSQTFFGNSGTGEFLTGKLINSYTVNWEDEAGTVYGGYIDLVTGELVSTLAMAEFTWGDCIGSTILGNTERRYIVFDYKKFKPINTNQFQMSNIFSQFGGNTYWATDDIRCMFGNSTVICKLPINTDDNTIIQVVGEMPEPIHYQLTPQQITSLLETNTIWSNADSVEVTYPVIPTCNLEKSRHNILASYPHKVTAESTDGAMNNFSTDMVGPMVDLRVGFKPIQSGEGTPSPENVREIGGTSGMVINTAGKNLAHIVGYSASTSTNIYSRVESNKYGTTISTISPERSVVITQTQSSYTTDISSYRNGYMCFIVDSLQFDHKYNVSFKITNIINNPLNASLSNIKIINPAGNQYDPNEVIENRVIYKNITFRQSINTPFWYGFDVRICGISFTLSDIMITEAIETDMSFEPYDGNVINVAFPLSGKNYWNPECIATSAATYTTTNTGITVTSSSAGTFRYVVFKTSNITSDDIGKTFTFSTNAAVTSGQARILVSIRKSNGGNFATLLERASDTDQTLTGSFTIPSGFPDNGWFQCAFYCTGSAGGSGEVEYSNTQLELGSSATTYEKYIPLYGGYVDPIAGEIVSERALITIDGTQTVQVRETYANSNQFRIAKSQLPIEPMTYNNEDVSSYMEVIMSDDEIETSLPWKFWVNSMTKAIHFLFPKSFTTVAQVQEYFAEHPLQICTRIQQPIHYPIDSHTLLTLRGANNIYSTANGDIATTYYTHGDQSTQWLPGEPIIDDNNMILTTSNGYAIGKEDDYIVY